MSIGRWMCVAGCHASPARRRLARNRSGRVGLQKRITRGYQPPHSEFKLGNWWLFVVSSVGWRVGIQKCCSRVYKSYSGSFLFSHIRFAISVDNRFKGHVMIN